MVPLSWYLIVAAALFCLGLYGVLARRNSVAILMGIELMLNAVILNLVAFWRYLEPARMSGQVFAVMVFAVAAAEAAVGLALIISLYRLKRTVVADEADLLRG
ncbi:MAG: NADH-quinone oxidoreductase subunit K [Chloroflexi bacterium RBG_16_64_43]|nr:MAG: NADH-quinone oxidoreductase subunit K [Chloroflexi bacterium RBG_16_64_43]